MQLENTDPVIDQRVRMAVITVLDKPIGVLQQEPLVDVQPGLATDIVTNGNSEAQLIGVGITRFDYPVTGADVTAVVYSANSSTDSVTLAMHDDGKGRRFLSKKNWKLFWPEILF